MKKFEMKDEIKKCFYCNGDHMTDQCPERADKQLYFLNERNKRACLAFVRNNDEEELDKIGAAWAEIAAKASHGKINKKKLKTLMLYQLALLGLYYARCEAEE